MEQKTVTLNLTVNQLNIVLSGMIKLPIEVGLDTFNEIQQQAQQQLGNPTSPSGPLSNKVIN